MRVSVEFRLPGNLPIDVRELLPSTVLSRTMPSLEKMTVDIAGERIPLKEIARINRRAEGEDELVLCGETHALNSIGRGMGKGKLHVVGDCSRWAGAEMAGGELVITGNAGDSLGSAMHGGMIRVHGDSGDWCGANLPGKSSGMDGGTILIRGSVGSEAGSGMRRGLLWVGKNSEPYTGARMLAGTIVIGGTLGKHAGFGLRRGSIIAGQAGSIMPGFNSTGYADMEWMRLTFIALHKMGMSIPATWQRTRALRFSGDHLDMGKGELIAYELAE